MTFDSTSVTNILLACIAIINVIILTIIYESIKNKKS
jgi:high-affinity nickel permease